MSGRWRLVAWFLAACAIAAPGVSRAQESELTQQPLPRFHRLFLPADEIDGRTWRQRYLPVDADQFKRDLQIVADDARGVPSPQRARLERAAYQARLVGDDLLVGDAQLTLTSSSAADPVLVSLAPSRLAIEKAVWHGSKKSAVFGAAPGGEQQLLVEGERLDFAWSRRGVRTASGAVGFELSLPPALMSRLELTVPTGADVVADRGIVTRPQVDDGPDGVWVVELGGHDQIELRIVPEEARRDRRPLTLLRQATTFEFSSRGINVGAQLRLDVHGEPLSRLQVDLDPSLHLIGAKFGDQALPWSATTDLETGQAHVHLEFPAPVAGTGRVIQLTAAAPLTTDRRFVLPRIQPQGVAWQEGTTDLLIPDTLILEQLLTHGCRQSRVTALPEPLAGESIEIQNFETGATVEVLLAEPRTRLALKRATVVEVGDTEVVSQCTLAVAAPGQHRLQIPIHDGWTIDSVESVVPSRTVQWDLSDGDVETAQLQIELAENERVVVRGHRAAPSTEQFVAGQLQMLDFASFSGGTRLISVRAAEGLELHWTESEALGRQDAAGLPQEDLGLFPRFPDGVVFSENDRFAQAMLGVTHRRPTYSADIHIDAAVQKDTLTETFTVLCTPDAARVERLLLHFSQPRETPLEWRLAGGNNSGQFSARKLSTGEQAKEGLPSTGEVWELLLQLARPGAFELRGQRKVPFSADTPISLLSVDRATTQRGTLAIRALGEIGLNIRNRGLMSVPAELLDDEHYQTARATYHYQPSGDDLEAEPLVSISPAKPQQAETGAWVWDLDLVTRFARDGLATHEATLRVETAGRRTVKVGLVRGATLQGAWINTEPLSLPDGSDWQIELPAGRSRATLTLHYATEVDLPTLTSHAAPVFPEIDIPCVARRWTVWLPPEYRLAAVDSHQPVQRFQPLNWSQRLWGPLGRGPGQHVFNPLVASDWRELFVGGSELQASQLAQQRLRDTLGTLSGEYADDEDLTYGQLISAASEGEAQQGRALLVDTAGLADVGITPQTRLPTLPADASGERGERLLDEARLTIISTPQGNLLTSQSRTASYRDQIVSMAPDSLGGMAKGSLAEQIERAARGELLGGFATIELWRAAAASQTAEWSSPPESPVAETDPQGWRSYALASTPVGASEICLVHAARMQSLTWAVMLAVVGIGLWKPIASARLLLLLIGISAAASLVVPVAYAPLFSAAFLGGLFCLAARMTIVEPPATVPGDAPTASHSRYSLSRTVATGLVLLACVLTAAALDAAEPASRDTLHTVLVPIDEDQQPLGDKYYVPDSLYEELLRRVAEVSGRPKAWLTGRGVYTGVLSRDPVTSHLELTRFEMAFDLQVLQSTVPVRVPLQRSVWGAIIRAARVDGRNIAPRWTTTGDAFLLDPMSLGPHKLELEVLPPLLAETRRQGFDLPLPPLGQSTLVLTFPEDVTSIEVPSAQGRVDLAAEGGELRAQLGAADRLSVRWPTGNGPDAAVPNLEVEELIWVKVRPGTTVVDARFTYRVLSGRVKTLRLLTDSRLRLLSSPASPSPVEAVHTIPGDPQRVELELAEEVTDQVSVDLSFLVTGASGVGSLRLPRLESADARSTRRWLGMSVDPALQHRVQAGEDSQAVPVGEYLGAWGTTDNKPLQAFEIPRGEPVWFLATQPGEPQTTVEQTTALGLGPASTTVRFDAAISITGGVLAQLAIEGPPGLKIDSISVREQDVERVARWSIDDLGRISAFLTTPIEGQQQLSLRGHWTAQDPASFAAPRWKLLQADVAQSTLQIYRQPAVLASVAPAAAARPLDEASIKRVAGLGAFVAAYKLEEGDSSVAVTLTPNQPQLSATAITFLERQGDRWIAELQYHVNVEGGVADSLQFEIPPQWSESLRVEPVADLKVLATAGEQRRQLTLTPSRPLEGEHRFTIRGRVAPSPGDRLSMPDVVPLHLDNVRRFVVLPRTLESQQVTWDTLRLTPARLPARFLPRQWRADQNAVYEVAGQHFQASLKAVRREEATARIKLADIQVLWLPDGNYRASAAFDLEPGGATSCLLELPEGCDLMHLSVEQLPTTIAPAGPNRVRFSLGPEQLPQRIELLYTGPPSRGANRAQLQPPKLAGVQVEQTLWTIYGQPSLGVSAPLGAHERLTSADLQLVRLETIADLVQLPTEVVSEHLPEEIARWYEAWRKRYWTGRSALRRHLIEVRRETSQSEESIAARQLDRQMTAMDKRLGAVPSGMSPFLAGDLASRFSAVVDSDFPPRHFLVTQPDGQIQLSSAAAAPSSALPRWLAAVAVVLLTGCGVWWLGSRPLPQASPWVVMSFLALGWWLLLTPSFLGLLLLIIVGLAANATRWMYPSVQPVR